MSDTNFLFWATQQMKGGNLKVQQKITRELREKYPGIDWVLGVVPFIQVFSLEPEVILTWLDKRTIKEVQTARSWCVSKVLQDTDASVEVEIMPECLKQLEEMKNHE